MVLNVASMGATSGSSSIQPAFCSSNRARALFDGSLGIPMVSFASIAVKLSFLPGYKPAGTVGIGVIPTKSAPVFSLKFSK